MGLGLPPMAYGDGIGKRRQVAFLGYSHNLSARDGELWDMKNLTSDYSPLLAPRAPRYHIRTLTKPNGFYAHGGLYWVDGTGFYADGEKKGDVTDSKKQFASLGKYIVILPDKAYYDTQTKELGNIEASWGGENGLSATFDDGTLYGEPAEANTITAADVTWSDYFRVGDGVTISGCTNEMANNKTAVIVEIEGNKLIFSENCFVISVEKQVDEEGKETEIRNSITETNVKIKREMPELDYICENENRLWGCKGDTIYACKLGDIFNWNVLDGISTSSYATQVGSAGDFTGMCSYLGYVIAFKEEHIYKVYGSKPSNFEVLSSASLGVEAGSSKSLAIAGEVLFYLSRTGVMAYTGGIPQLISAPFGTVRYQNAVGGSDGVKYYVSMQDMDGTYTMFVFDTRTNLWHKEDGLQVIGFGWDKELYFLDSTGKLWMNGNARTVPDGAIVEQSVESMAEFGDFVEDDPNQKGVSKLQLRMELSEGAAVTIAMMFDSDGVWQEVKSLTAQKKRSYYLPIIPQRCDHFRIKITGIGAWKLYSLVRESYIGSEI